MSKWDRLSLPLRECCVLVVQQRIERAVAGDRLACGCGQKLEHIDGRWRLAQDSVTVNQNSGTTYTG
jgi:hypothetical protein